MKSLKITKALPASVSAPADAPSSSMLQVATYYNNGDSYQMLAVGDLIFEASASHVYASLPSVKMERDMKLVERQAKAAIDIALDGAGPGGANVEVMGYGTFTAMAKELNDYVSTKS